jgi:predicted secreted protein with PEFG-CTERM motif
VVIHSVSGVTTGAFTEEADFGVVVVPEFPVSAMIIAAIAVAAIIAVTRFKGINLGSMFGGRNAL